ncbi:hypothetical protein [Enterovirga rhinocerotis]|uniref:Uncharacterized protein n=1 Tax=Enterovirga rhinocerotis TaxID=1339210 RepID=A0A4R7C9C9_9HYPH|nr:hypothetical protein [Enterovirga rhinocerotis]TDR93516.1 hypothetical protein EV668_0779 [Enterovirga rhinocerotis]
MAEKRISERARRKPRGRLRRTDAVRGPAYVLAGVDARHYVEQRAVEAGLKPQRVLAAVDKLTEPGKMILHLLGLKPEEVRPPHPVPDTQRLDIILCVVEALAERLDPRTGRPRGLFEAYKLAPRYLANPSLREREGVRVWLWKPDGVRTDLIPVTGRQERLMAPDSVKKAHRRARESVLLRFLGDPDEFDDVGWERLVKMFVLARHTRRHAANGSSGLAEMFLLTPPDSIPLKNG